MLRFQFSRHDVVRPPCVGEHLMPLGNAVSLLKKMVANSRERAGEKSRDRLVQSINFLEDMVRELSDEALGAKTDEFRRRLDDGASLDDLLPIAFAVVRESARRTLGQRHNDVQLVSGAVLHQGKIAEMKPGEGTTLVATLPAYLNAISGDGVHIVTANDYLARRDPVWMGPIYHILGLTVGCLQHDAAYLYDPELPDGGRGGFPYLTPVSSAEAYRADILYGTSNEFGFDYLRDNIVVDADMQVQARFIFRPTHHFAIIYEVDNILIDAARTPLVISGPAQHKYDVTVQDELVTYSTITLQNYFRMYHKLAGMTGTAITDADEFYGIYGFEVVVVPTNMPVTREDASDLIFPTAEGKWQAIVKNVIQRSRSGQPVLVGTTSIETSDALSDRLWRRGVQHRVLNDRNREQHSSILAHAGRSGAVTVSPVILCRSANIILGGADTDRQNWLEEHNRVVSLGGLHVIGTEHHEVRRMDNQLRNLAGLRGDPGSSQFFVSLDDELMQRFGGDRIKNVMNWSGLNDDEPLEDKLLTKSICSAQVKVEGHQFEMRRHLLNFDDVLNRQRSVIYEQRYRVLVSDGLRERILDMLGVEFDRLVATYLQARRADDWDAEGFVAALRQTCPPPAELDTPEKVVALRRDHIGGILGDYVETLYEVKERDMGHGNMEALVRLLLLRAIDTHWSNHLVRMDHLCAEAQLRSVSYQDALVVYRIEGQQAFSQLTLQIQHEVSRTLFDVSRAPEAPDRE